MTLISRLVGDWQSRWFAIVNRFGLRLRPRSFGEAVAQLRERLFCAGGPAKGIVFLTPDAIEEGSGFHFLVMDDSKEKVLAHAGKGNYGALVVKEGRMCRLYGFRATEPTKIECTLVHAQNALIVQSYRDQSGRSHLNGWGLALYQDGRLQTVRQAKAAVDDARFRRAAGRAYSDTVLAHVRRATVGRVAVENTHPFCYGRWAFVHNGTLANFIELRPSMLAIMTPQHRAAIQGETDSEHIFHLLLSAHDSAPALPLRDILRQVLGQIADWCHQIDSAARVGLNVLLTDGEQLVGCRWGRTLHYVERVGVRDCEVCGFPHIRHDPRHSYRAVVIASEPISNEQWREIPERAVFAVSPEMALQIDPLPSAAEAGQAVLA